MHSFSFLGSEMLTWKNQLLNDLQNFYQSEGLELIGALNSSNSSKGKAKGNLTRDFNLVFYRIPHLQRSLKFPYYLEFLYEEPDAGSLTKLLNSLLLSEWVSLRTCLSVYEQDEGRLKCHVLVFERAIFDEGEGGTPGDKIYMVVESQEAGLNVEGLRENLYEQEVCHQFRIAGMLIRPKKPELLIFVT